MFEFFKRKKHVSPILVIRPTTEGAVELAAIFDEPQCKERDVRFWRKVYEIAEQERVNVDSILSYLCLGATFYIFDTRLEVRYERTESGWLFYTK